MVDAIFARQPLDRSCSDRDPATNRSLALNPGDEELVASARRGDRRAFEELVERHQQRAYHIAFDFARDREDAKDLSQEAFLKVYKSRDSFRADSSSSGRRRA